MSEAPLPKKTIEVLGRKMAFHQSGEGNPILMLHGNPTSSLVVHDWGSALGFDWASHHRDRIRGIAYMEG